MMEEGGHVNEALDLEEDVVRTNGQQQTSNGSAKQQVDQVNETLENVKLDDDEEEEIIFEDLEFEPNFITKIEDKISAIWSQVVDKISEANPDLVRAIPKLICLALYFAFFFSALHYYSSNEENLIDWCGGFGFLLIITILFFAGVLYGKVVKPLCSSFLQTSAGVSLSKSVLAPANEAINNVLSKKLTGIIISAIFIGAMALFVIVDSANDRRRLVSGIGLLVMLLLGWICSKHKGRVVWRHIIWGLALQFVFGLAILRWEVGKNIFQCLGDKVK